MTTLCRVEELTLVAGDPLFWPTHLLQSLLSEANLMVSFGLLEFCLSKLGLLEEGVDDLAKEMVVRDAIGAPSLKVALDVVEKRLKLLVLGHGS